MALVTMASYKAASSCRGAKCAAEDAWLLSGNVGPVIDAFLWKRMYNGILVQGSISLHKPLTESRWGIDGIDGIAEKKVSTNVGGIDGIAEKKVSTNVGVIDGIDTD